MFFRRKGVFGVLLCQSRENEEWRKYENLKKVLKDIICEWSFSKTIGWYRSEMSQYLEFIGLFGFRGQKITWLRVLWLYGRNPFNHSVMFGGDKHYGSGDLFLIYHVMSRDHMFKEMCNFISGSFLFRVSHHCQV